MAFNIQSFGIIADSTPARSLKDFPSYNSHYITSSSKHLQGNLLAEKSEKNKEYLTKRR